MWAFRAGVIAVPLLVIGLPVGMFLFVGLSGDRSVTNRTNPDQLADDADSEAGRIQLEIEDEQAGRFTIIATIAGKVASDDETLIEPDVSKTMVGHNMGRMLIPMSRRSDGVWVGTGSFSMGGRWRFRIIFDGEMMEVDHTVW